MDFFGAPLSANKAADRLTRQCSPKRRRKQQEPARKRPCKRWSWI